MKTRMDCQNADVARMPEASELNGVSEMSQDKPLLNIGAWDKGQLGQVTAPQNWVSYRVTVDSADVVYDAFRNVKTVIAKEISKSGVQHYHIVVEGHDDYDVVRKRLIRAKLGTNKTWSKKNNGEFFKAVAYTIKCGDYVTRKGFHEYTDYVEKNCPWKFENVLSEVPSEERDTDKDWMLTYNNLLRVAHNYARKKNLKTDDLGNVLAHMTEHTRWIPSPQMMKNGLDPWYFKMYKFRCGSELTVPDWWTPRGI